MARVDHARNLNGTVMITRLAMLSAVLLSGCGFLLPPHWEAGTDPRGMKLKSDAEPVLAAIRNYEHEKSVLPSSLDELVPAYLARLPESRVKFDRRSATVAVHYDPPWPDRGLVTCSTPVANVQWTCTVLI